MAKACFHFMRVILVIISLIFMLLGLGVLSLSLFIKLYPSLTRFISESEFGPAVNICLYVLIGIGAFLAIFGFVGCLGACRKSTACLGIYITMLLIIILSEIVVGVIIVVYTKMIMGYVDDSLENMVKSDTTPGMLNFVQTKLQCCGADGPDDYEKRSLPSSCCPNPSGMDCTKERAFDKGCKKRYKAAMGSKGFSILIGNILGIALFEFIAIAFAIAVCCYSRRQDAGYVSVVT